MRRLLLLPLLSLLLVAAAPATALAAPTATTDPASDIGQNSATVRATIDPDGDTGYRFQFGRTASYGTQTADAQLSAFSGPTQVSETLAGLAENSTFHYRVLAWPLSDDTKIVYGADRTFHTIALPNVSTGSPRSTTPTGTTFFGKVDPNGSETTWYFEWGRTKSYGNRTPELSVGSGQTAVTVASTLSALAPNTTYHVRMVAANAAGIKRGRDRGFRTLRQPTGIVLAAPVERVPYGGQATIDGKVQGAGVDGIRVALESRPFPFTAPFDRVGDIVAAGRDGSFRLVTPPLFVSTRLRVVTRTTPAVTSAQINALTAPLVRAGAVRVDRRRYRIQGTITPDIKRARVSLQRRAGRKWVAVRRTRTTRVGGRVGYRVLVKRARKARRYRVVLIPRNGAYDRAISNSVKVPRIQRR
jgi:hypothetical protein